MATSLFSGTIAAGTTVAATTLNLPTRGAVGPGSLGVVAQSLYAAVSATTGIDTQTSYSNDGVIFTDFASLNIITTPTAGVASAKGVTLMPFSGATTARFQLANRDATNAAAVSLTYAEQF